MFRHDPWSTVRHHRPTEGFFPAWLPARFVLALLAVATSVAGLLNDFVYDDVPLIRDNLRVHGFAGWREILTQPYWPPPFVENLWRPLALLLAACEYTLGGGSPLVFRLVSYALYAAGAVALYLLASRLVRHRAAFAAVALFAVHPVHVEAVALGVNQGELVVGLIAAVMVARYVEKRRGDGLAGADWLFLATLYAIAALTKESGFVLPALLVAAELLLVDGEPLRARAARVGIGFAGLATIGAGLLALRSSVLSGRLAGVTPNADLVGLDFSERIVTMLQVVPQWGRLLIWPQRLQVDFAPGAFVLPTHVGAPELLGTGLIVLIVGAVVTARRRAPVVSFGLAWCAIALLPVSNLVPTGIVLAERTLFLPSMGFLLAVAGIGEWIARLTLWPTRWIHRALSTVCVVLLVLGFVRSASRHSVWNSTHLRVEPARARP